jgi:peptidoglycan/LPS O-acetylase OafA/YrhL
MGFGRFALIRFVRLWPLVALGVLLAIAQAWLMPAADPVLRQPVVVPLVLLNLALLPGLVGTSPNLFPVNPPHWSLFYEMAINLAFAAGLVRLSNRWLAALALAGFAVIAAGIAADGHANIGWARDQVGFGLGRVTCTFLAGVLLHRWKGRAGHLSVANGWWLALLLTALALTLPAGPLRPAYDMAFLLLGAPLLVWPCPFSRRSAGYPIRSMRCTSRCVSRRRNWPGKCRKRASRSAWPRWRWPVPWAWSRRVSMTSPSDAG